MKKKCEKKVSIIVPVYNASAYLEKLIGSLKNQTYSNIEVIFVNDGSQDNSLEILKKNKAKNFYIINEENGGVSKARNNGLENAKGDYVTFVDSDDYIDKNYVKCLVDNLEKNDSDLCVVSYQRVYNDKTNDIIEILDCSLALDDLNKKIKFLNELNGSGICGKLYKRELMPRFKKMEIGEDTLYNLEYIIKNNKVTVVNKPYYYYVDNASSAINSCKKDLLKHLNAILKEVEIDDIYVFYAYRIYQEYLLNIFRGNKKILKNCIKEIEDLDLVYKFLTQNVNKIIETFSFFKKLYIKIVNFCLKNKCFMLLYIIEKMKLEIKYGKKSN